MIADAFSRFLGPSIPTLRRINVRQEFIENVLDHIPEESYISTQDLARSLGRAVLTNSHWSALLRLNDQGLIAWDIQKRKNGRGLNWSFKKIIKESQS